MLNAKQLPEEEKIEKVKKFGERIGLFSLLLIFLMIFFWNDGSYVLYALPKQVIDILSFVVIFLFGISGYLFGFYFCVNGFVQGVIRKRIKKSSGRKLTDERAKDYGVGSIVFGVIFLVLSFIMFYMVIEELLYLI